MNTIPYSQGHYGVRLIQPEREFICIICGKPGITRGKGTQVHQGGACEKERNRRTKERMEKRRKAA